MAQLLLSPIGVLVQQLSNSGQPLSGGKVYVYVAGTTTPQVTYTDSTGTTQNANPIILNSAGRLPNVSVWVNSNTPHKLILQDSNGVTLSTIDQLYGINDPFLINQVSSVLPTSGGTANAQTVTNPTPITAQGNGTEQWFIPGLANTAGANINVDSLGNMVAHYLGKALVGGELQPNVPVIIKSDGTFWNLSWSAKGPASDYYADTGAVNAMVITANMAQTAYKDGMRFKVKVANTTTSATPTLNVNGIGAVGCYYMDLGTGLAAGSLIANGIYELEYNSSLNSSAGGFQAINPSRVTASFTGTLATGFTTTPTGTINYVTLPDGKTVQVFCNSGFTATSSGSGWTVTGVPSSIQSANARFMTVSRFTDAGVGLVGTFSGTNGSTWTALGGSAMSSSGFTNTGNKGISSSWWATYSLD